jgi:hypothetical protein
MDLKPQTADPEPFNPPPPRQPGISFFYGGLVHRHTVISILMQCITSMALTSIVWAVWGFSLAFGESGGGFMGSPSSYPFFSNLSPCTPLGYPMVKIPRKTSLSPLCQHDDRGSGGSLDAHDIATSESSLPGVLGLGMGVPRRSTHKGWC